MAGILFVHSQTVSTWKSSGSAKYRSKTRATDGGGEYRMLIGSLGKANGASESRARFAIGKCVGSANVIASFGSREIGLFFPGSMGPAVFSRTDAELSISQRPRLSDS
jgi:hypothetical protein